MKILYVEDNPVDIDLTLHHLKKNAPQMVVVTATSQAEALKIIKAPDFSEYDLVLTDMHLQDGDGIAILAHIRSHSIPVAVVLLTGQGDEDSAVAALKAGADDYMVKKRGYLDNLPRVFENALTSYRESKDRNGHALKVLYVEHNEPDVELTRIHFEKHAAHIRLDVIYRVSEFCEILNNTDHLASYDVWLLDYRLPQENALEILKKIRLSAYRKIPVILVTGKGDEEIAVKALKLGAFDYVTKNQGYLFKLPSVIENAHYSRRLEREHEALIETEKRYRSLFENSPMTMLLIDPASGDIVDANLAAVRFYGWSREELIAKKIDEINILTPEEIQEEMRAAAKENRNHFLFKHQRSDGTICDVEVYSGPIEVGSRSLLHSMVYDITQRIKMMEEKEKLQKQLIQGQKMEAIGQLAGGIAHDFNNILSAVIGYTELTLDDVERGSIIERNLQEVYTAGKRAKDLIRQILAFARQSEEETRPIQVDAIAEEVLKFIRSSIPATIEIRKNMESDSLIMGNATQVHQVLMNLCTNAAHAMEDEGGILEVSLKDVTINGSIGVQDLGLKPGNYIEIKVSDTGTGISPDILDSIFNPYFTTKGPGEGTGMGLSVVHGIIDNYGGNISVDSTLGKGTVFTIHLPVTLKQEKHRPYQSEDLPAGTERILFVDDELTIAEMGSQTLESLGYSVTARTSSLEALELVRSKPSEFDLIITDMTMPNMTGDKLAVELMKIRPDIPVILCTGYSKKISEKSAIDIGIKAFVYKPVVKADLAKTVRKVLNEAKSPTQK